MPHTPILMLKDVVESYTVCALSPVGFNPVVMFPCSFAYYIVQFCKQDN